MNGASGGAMWDADSRRLILCASDMHALAAAQSGY